MALSPEDRKEIKTLVLFELQQVVGRARGTALGGAGEKETIRRETLNAILVAISDQLTGESAQEMKGDEK